MLGVVMFKCQIFITLQAVLASFFKLVYFLGGKSAHQKGWKPSVPIVCVSAEGGKGLTALF